MKAATCQIELVHCRGQGTHWTELRKDGHELLVPAVDRNERLDWYPFGRPGPRIAVVATFFERIVHLFPDDAIELHEVNGEYHVVPEDPWFYWRKPGREALRVEDTVPWWTQWERRR